MAAQTVLVEGYWQEIKNGLLGLGHSTFHVVLDTDADTLHARIDADGEEPESTRPWRHQHVETYQAALKWLRPAVDLVIDTEDLDAPTAADQITAVAGRLRPPRARP